MPCPEADGRGWLCLRDWESRISATDSVLCLKHCSCLCVGDKEQEQSGMQTHVLIYSDLLLRQQETFHDVLALVQVQETLAYNIGQNLNCLSRLRASYLLSWWFTHISSSLLTSIILYSAFPPPFIKSKPHRSNNLVTKYGCIWTVHFWYHTPFHSDLMIFVLQIY